MIIRPQSAEQAVTALQAGAKARAGGTDLMERLRHSRDPIALVEVGRLHTRLGLEGEELVLGAGLPIATLAADEGVRGGWPALVAAARGLATPQIRAVATVGGNLLQEVRCPYFRSPLFRCLHKRGEACLARVGDHENHVCIDQGPCAAPHPSTLGMALLAYEATAICAPRRSLPLEQLFGDGENPRRTHRLGPEELLVELRVPRPPPGEGAATLRLAQRARAEWPTVEALARLVVEGGHITFARLAVGGVANTPLRLPEVEAALLGKEPGRAVFEEAALRVKGRCRPLPGTVYKVDLLITTLADTLQAASEARP